MRCLEGGGLWSELGRLSCRPFEAAGVAWEERAASEAPSTALDTPNELLELWESRSCSQFVGKATHLPEQRRMLVDFSSRPNSAIAYGLGRSWTLMDSRPVQLEM